MLGILGGMGPIAALDLVEKIQRLSNVSVEQEHLPVLLYNDPRIPDRSRAILDAHAASPVPAMAKGLRQLELCGATRIAIACNTAHYWLGELRQATTLPILDMIRLAADEALRRCPRDGCVGILATEGTIHSGLYHQALERSGVRCVVLAAPHVSHVHEAIAAVKANRPDIGAGELLAAAALLEQRGADVLLLGCTELSLCWSRSAATRSYHGAHVVDPTLALARACLRGDSAVHASIQPTADKLSAATIGHS